MRTPILTQALRLARPLGGLGVVLAAVAMLAGAQGGSPAPRILTELQFEPSRQVTLIGILATPGSTSIDPQLASVAVQLQRLLPNHSFKLLAVRTERLASTQVLSLPVSEGMVLRARMTQVEDPQGKVRLRVEVQEAQGSPFETDVVAPPNQLVFLEKSLDGESRLLIGLGAR